MKIKKHSGHAEWGSRFGYLMVAAGASIGLGNVWKFPYLAYRGGGGIFILTYLVIVFLLAKPMVEMETAIARKGKSDAVSVYETIKKRWGIIGWIANICTLMINSFYVVVGGWVLCYALQFVFVGTFNPSAVEFYNNLISSPIEPLLYSFSILLFVTLMLLFGITNVVERISKYMLPLLFLLLIVCAIYSILVTSNSMKGLEFYLYPNISEFSFKVFADAVTQVLFSVGIGWGIFTTLGANVSTEQNIRKDSFIISYMDTIAALLAGLVIIPAAFAVGIDVKKGPELIFDVMVVIFGQLPGGRLIGSLFFLALFFAVISSLFTFIEIAIRTFEIRLNLGRTKAILLAFFLIGSGNILVSLGFGPLKTVLIPWLSYSGIVYYNFYDWFDCFSGYVLLPLGCLLTCWFTYTAWTLKEYEKELTVNGRDGSLTLFDKFLIVFIVPALMIIVLLNVFGFIN